MNKDQLLELYRRAFAQIALQAAVDAQRVFDLAETMEPMVSYLDEADGWQRCREQLETYCRHYPDGADYLRETLDTRGRPLELPELARPNGFALTQDPHPGNAPDL